MSGSRIAYVAFMVIASAVAAVLLRRRQQCLAIDRNGKIGIALGGLIGATFASKLPFVLGANPDDGALAAWLSDGKTILWGLAGGYVGVEIAKWSFRVNLSTGDSFVVPVAIAIAIAIGRVGCLMYGCCYGIATDQTWGMRFVTAADGGSLLRHPSQLYEILFHVTFSLVAWASQQSPKHRKPLNLSGNWMPIYLCAYAAFRFFSEFLRPELVVSSGLTFYQWSSIGIGTAFAILLAARLYAGSRRRHPASFRQSRTMACTGKLE